MKIIVDVDDVLADTFGALEDRFGKAADATGEDLQLYFPGTNVKSILNNVEFHVAIPPLDGAAEGVRWLLEAGHSARYLSSRPPAMEDPTREWLRHWQFPEIPLQCLGRDKKKAALAIDPYDLLIDDMLTYLTIARDRGKRAIAFANAWNTTWNDLSVKGWSEINDVI
jgi:hypothetical protein